MDKLLNKYNQIAEQSFFTDLDARWDEFYLILQYRYNHFYEATRKKIKGIEFSQIENKETHFLKFNYNAVYDCFRFRRIQAEDKLKSIIRRCKSLEKVKQTLWIYIQEFEWMKGQLENMKLVKHLEPYRIKILADHMAFINQLKGTYLANDKFKSLRQPTIKWLGQKNQLPTLLYDLLKGSKVIDEKGKQINQPPLISASLEDLMVLVEQNFLDSDGQSFKHTTLKDIFSSSKSKLKDKATGDSRIQLKYNI